MPTPLCSSACYYSLSLWEWWTDTCVQYNHIKVTVHSSSFAVFLEQSLHCCYQITFGTVTSATQLNPLPSTLRLGVAFSSQRVIRMLPSQMSCHPPALASIILTGCPRVSPQWLLLGSLSATLLIIQEDSPLSYVLYFKQSTAWQLLQHLGDPQLHF